VRQHGHAAATLQNRYQARSLGRLRCDKSNAFSWRPRWRYETRPQTHHGDYAAGVDHRPRAFSAAHRPPGQPSDLQPEGMVRAHAGSAEPTHVYRFPKRLHRAAAIRKLSPEHSLSETPIDPNQAAICQSASPVSRVFSPLHPVPSNEIKGEILCHDSASLVLVRLQPYPRFAYSIGCRRCGVLRG
jgi:hypothetical protein